MSIVFSSYCARGRYLLERRRRVALMPVHRKYTGNKAGWCMWVGGAVQSNDLDTLNSPSLAPLRLGMVTPAKRSILRPISP